MGGDLINTLVTIAGWIIAVVIVGAAGLWCVICATVSFAQRQYDLADQEPYGDWPVLPTIKAPFHNGGDTQ